jgi:hypothetical protein
MTPHPETGGSLPSVAPGVQGGHRQAQVGSQILSREQRVQLAHAERVSEDPVDRMPATLSYQCHWTRASVSRPDVDSAGCPGGCHSADRVYDTRVTGWVAIENQVCWLSYLVRVADSRPFSGKATCALGRVSSSRSMILAIDSDLGWRDSSGGRPTTSHESDLALPSEPRVALTPTGQGNMADSTLR